VQQLEPIAITGGQLGWQDEIGSQDQPVLSAINFSAACSREFKAEPWHLYQSWLGWTRE